MEIVSNFEPTIPEFYKNKNIFITGASGFIGKALVEKLLRSCPEVGNIFILIREKKGKSVEERIKSLIKEQIFQKVQLEQPDLKLDKRIIPVTGDCKQLNLGLSPEDRNILIENVNIIFHAAATVRFDEPLIDAGLINVRGTREVCQLALDMKYLIAFIHISTAFVNCGLSEVEEKFYSRKMDWRKLIKIVENIDKYPCDILTKKIIDEMPNTYTFTKNIAENLVYDMLNGKVLCKIFRPSIVWGSMSEEPIKGWLEGFNGLTAIVIAASTGLLQVIFSNPNVRNDYIPVDVCIKSLIVSTWDMFVRNSQSRIILPIEIIHCSSFNAKWLRFTTSELITIGRLLLDDISFNNMIILPLGDNTNSWIIWYIKAAFTMLLPAILFDSVLRVLGKEPRLLKIQKKIYASNQILVYFMITNFEFVNNNLLQLQKRIQENDKNEFDYEFQNGDFESYLKDVLLGMRRFVMNQPDSTLEYAKRRYHKMKRIAKFVKYLFCIIVASILFKYFYNNVFS